jgi:hypothetical protein
MLHVLPVWFIVILEAYGWLPPIDDPKLGFGRGNLYHRDAMVLLAGYMTLHGHMGWGEWHGLSYLQVISKLSPSHPVIRPFLLTSKGTTPTLVFEGVNMCERCRADVLLVIFTVVCWQLHIFSVSSMMFHAYQGRVQRIAFLNIFQGLNGLNLQAIPVTRQDCSHIMVGGNRSSAPIAPGSWCSWWQWVSRDTVSLNVRCKQLIAADSSCSFCWKLTGGFLYFQWASFMHLTNVGS